MTFDNYPIARRNAEKFKNYPYFTEDYTLREFEWFFGDEAPVSTFHWYNDRWIDIALDYMLDATVKQIRIDGEWAYIEAGGKVLLNRLGGVNLPPLPSESQLIQFYINALAKTDS
ncbi:hypothetical protein C7B80_25080 [Cyanosarcina cf. burmensis CCALA 770]|nr:hypothetical protein C7B80_25080 [Cyanosarcina cf. burmensis CCALA 770]